VLYFPQPTGSPLLHSSFSSHYVAKCERIDTRGARREKTPFAILSALQIDWSRSYEPQLVLKGTLRGAVPSQGEQLS